MGKPNKLSFSGKPYVVLHRYDTLKTCSNVSIEWTVGEGNVVVCDNCMEKEKEGCAVRIKKDEL